MEKDYDYLIVGAGLSGAVFAQQAHLVGKRCLVIDKRSNAGGNTYCEDFKGIKVHAYGAHIFHTSNKRVWQYVNSFVDFNRFINSPLANYQGKLYNLPFNMNTFNRLWRNVRTPEEARARIDKQRRKYSHITMPANLEEQALVLCGEDIYTHFIKGYTEKQWGRDAKDLPAFIIKRIPLRFIYDNNYFDDPYQGIPIGGYNTLIERLLEGIDVCLNMDYFECRDQWDEVAHKIVYTGCIDEFFDYKFGHLEYRSLKFEHEYMDNTDFQGNAVVNYTDRETPYTRIIEHKHFEMGEMPNHTIVTREYPIEYNAENEPYYPINDEKNMRLLEQYKKIASRIPNVLFAGRLAQYAYYDMDDAIEAALNLARKELS